MIALPTILSSPFAAAIANGMDLPSFGAMLAWGAIAALVGSAIGVLRGNGRHTTVRLHPNRRASADIAVFRRYRDGDDSHREAA